MLSLPKIKFIFSLFAFRLVCFYTKLFQIVKYCPESSFVHWKTHTRGSMTASFLLVFRVKSDSMLNKMRNFAKLD